jgi:hypothetical protein
MTVKLTLTVNDTPIPADYFVESFIDHTVSGMMESLEGTGKINDLQISISLDKVDIILNGTKIPLNEFVNKFVRGTIVGIVSNLKGVKDIRKLELEIHK